MIKFCTDHRSLNTNDKKSEIKQASSVVSCIERNKIQLTPHATIKFLFLITAILEDCHLKELMIISEDKNNNCM